MNNQSFKIIVCGGGTGGHIYPALSIANELKIHLLKKYNSVDFLFLGKKNGIEDKIISKEGYNISGLCISGIPRKISKDLFKFPFKIFHTYNQCLKIFKNFHPNIIIGTGSYVSAIPIYFAYKKKIPIFIQEQNIIPGYTNIVLGNLFAKKIFIAYEKTSFFFPKKKTYYTGNPLRKEILLNIKFNKQLLCNKFHLNPNKPIILSLGGSQGAQSINNVWIKNIKKLIDEDIQLIWQIGDYDFERIYNHVICHHPNIILKKFIHNIHLAYYISDIVVARAGGLTISEISVLGKPSILIPFPKSSKDHQLKNAKNLLKLNAIFLIKDEDIKNKLINTVFKILKNDNLKKKLSKNILKISKPNAANLIANEIIKTL